MNLLCRVLGVSTSGYYAYLKRPPKSTSSEDASCLKRIKRAYHQHKGTYGAKRIAGFLKTSGYTVNHKRVARLLLEDGLKAVVRRPKTSKSAKQEFAGHVYDNLLKTQL